MKLQTLLNSIQPLKIVGDTEKEITSIAFDTAKVVEGSMFVAQKGTNVDGHTFILDAVEKGACAVVLSDESFLPSQADNITYILVKDTHYALGMLAHCWYGCPSEKLALVGVTGTNGKTTTATLLYELAEALGYKAGLLSTVCNYVHTQALPSTHTTPDALAINELLAQMVQEGCEYAFMEVSSHSLAQQRVAGLHFKGGIFTNLTRDHIDYHKTFENYRDTKKLLFDNLSKESFAITNKDDKNGLYMLQNCKAKTYTYSLQSMADYKAKILEINFDGTTLDLNGHEITMRLVGKFNVSNFLGIYAAAMALGFDSEETLRALSAVKPVNGRFETIYSPKGWVAIVDYAHTPDALENVLETINEVCLHNKHIQRNIITIVGCGGNRDKGKRPMMARIAYDKSNQAILTSDNPRDEEPMDILNDMLTAFDEKEKKKVLVIENRQTAIQTACTMAQKGDVILVAGKGHEDYQIIKGVKHHFDDHEIVKAYI